MQQSRENSEQFTLSLNVVDISVGVRIIIAWERKRLKL